jgi:hypothetical protein
MLSTLQSASGSSGIRSFGTVDIERTDDDVDEREGIFSEPEIYTAVVGLMPFESRVFPGDLFKNVFQLPELKS